MPGADHRRRSLAALRAQVEPVSTAAYARFLPAWQQVGSSATSGVDGLAGVIDQLAGVPLPASAVEPLVFGPRTVLACYVVGVVVTMAAAWLPARRTSRIAPVQALRDDVALPETSIHRRLLLGVVAIVVGAAAMAAGLFTDVPRGGYVLGAGTLLVLLGVTAVSPVVGRPFLAAAQAAYRRVFGAVGALAGQNSLRNPRRTTATASALMIGLALAGIGEVLLEARDLRLQTLALGGELGLEALPLGGEAAVFLLA